MESTDTSNIEKHQQPQQPFVRFQSAEGSFKQPTAAELTIYQLSCVRSQAQELSNEFARLLNRGSSLE